MMVAFAFVETVSKLNLFGMKPFRAFVQITAVMRVKGHEYFLFIKASLSFQQVESVEHGWCANNEGKPCEKM